MRRLPFLDAITRRFFHLDETDETKSPKVGRMKKLLLGIGVMKIANVIKLNGYDHCYLLIDEAPFVIQFHTDKAFG